MPLRREAIGAAAATGAATVSGAGRTRAQPAAAPAGAPLRQHRGRAPDGVEVVPPHRGGGHAPFREDTPRFNREPAELARSAPR